MNTHTAIMLSQAAHIDRIKVCLEYQEQIADALQFAHNEKFIHRDIKPENLLVGRRNEILLSDFGIYAIVHSTLSRQTEDIVGTPSYMAPEQIQKHPTPASDQYALAVMVYQWLSGTLPFEGSSREVTLKHLFVPPPPLRDKIPTILPAVEDVVMKALAKDPKQRFTTVTDFERALEDARMQPINRAEQKAEAKQQLQNPSLNSISNSQVAEDAESPKSLYGDCQGGTCHWVSKPIPGPCGAWTRPCSSTSASRTTGLVLTRDS